jgi:hypothetical protein
LASENPVEPLQNQGGHLAKQGYLAKPGVLQPRGNCNRAILQMQHTW